MASISEALQQHIAQKNQNILGRNILTNTSLQLFKVL